MSGLTEMMEYITKYFSCVCNTIRHCRQKALHILLFIGIKATRQKAEDRKMKNDKWKTEKWESRELKTFNFELITSISGQLLCFPFLILNFKFIILNFFSPFRGRGAKWHNRLRVVFMPLGCKFGNVPADINPLCTRSWKVYCSTLWQRPYKSYLESKRGRWPELLYSTTDQFSRF